MAIMIPKRIGDSTESNAEKRIFKLLKNDPDTIDWFVLHSVGLAKRSSGPYGEIDFVIVIPQKGIVCLEVKGGRISCKDGDWYTTNRSSKQFKLRKSPFLQARESMFALRDSIIKNFGTHSRESQCPVGCAVVFSDVVCPPITPEIERADVIDFRDLKNPISISIKRVVRKRLHRFQRNCYELHPSQSECVSIKNFLRPEFDLIVAKSVTIGQSEEKILSLTQEQYNRLDELEDNPRCFFEGAAGTGKTLLALQYANQSTTNGDRVALVCYNRLIGIWLNNQITTKSLKADRFYRIAKSIIESSTYKNEFLVAEEKCFDHDENKELFENVYPYYCEIALEEVGPQFDVLVVDEAQDLFDRNCLDLFNLMLVNGLQSGKWAMFGDFTHQALFNKRTDGTVNLAKYCDSFTKFKLKQNCRNTSNIAMETVQLTGFSDLPFKLGTATGLPVDYNYYKSKNEVVEKLSSKINTLINDNVSIEDIIILSTRKLNNSCLARVEKVLNFSLVDVTFSMLKVKPSVLKFSTIHAFKGMESQVVIVVDIDRTFGDSLQSLLYVAMSRARSLLILMINEGIRKAVEARIKQSLEQGLNE